jgi:hypothetical protein
MFGDSRSLLQKGPFDRIDRFGNGPYIYPAALFDRGKALHHCGDLQRFGGFRLQQQPTAFLLRLCGEAREWSIFEYRAYLVDLAAIGLRNIDEPPVEHRTTILHVLLQQLMHVTTISFGVGSATDLLAI